MSKDAEALFAEYYQPVFRYLCRASGHADVARDLAQDVFLRVSRATIPVASEESVQPWIFRIARNLVIDHQRQKNRTPVPVPVEHIGQRTASQEAVAAVNEALAALADIDRDVFLMREVAGLGYLEIAAACDLTPDAVRSRIHRARLQLRAQLAAPIATHRTGPLRQSGRRS